MTRQVMPLIPHLARAVSWWPLGAAILLAVLAQVPAVASAEPSSWAVLTGLWLAAGVLGAGAGFALPDPMASTVVTPVSRWIRQWLRAGLVLLPAVLFWTLLYVVVRRAVAPVVTWPDGFVVLQAAVCGLLPVAAAAFGARYRDTATGALLGPVTQGVALVVTLFFTEPNSPWSLPAADGWTTAQRVWPLALLLVVLSLLLANREAAGPRGA